MEIILNKLFDMNIVNNIISYHSYDDEYKYKLLLKDVKISFLSEKSHGFGHKYWHFKIIDDIVFSKRFQDFNEMANIGTIWSKDGSTYFLMMGYNKNIKTMFEKREKYKGDILLKWTKTTVVDSEFISSLKK